jgi:hypothetical protein
MEPRKDLRVTSPDDINPLLASHNCACYICTTAHLILLQRIRRTVGTSKHDQSGVHDKSEPHRGYQSVRVKYA